MSGIAGVFLKSSDEDVDRMLNKLVHRGPDGQGIKNLPGGTLGHRQLVILDAKDGNQPMEVDKTWITYDGEIYNSRELTREQLGEEVLRTGSDAEVIVQLYRKLGPRFVELLDGVFAIVLLHGNELFMARDPLGVRPLYYSERDGAFYFASEIKALARVTNTIHEFPSGYYLHSRQGWHRYFSLDPLPMNNLGEANIDDLIYPVLKEAVRKRLIWDIPVGLCLSGRLHDNIVAVLASQQSAQLHSFSVSMEGREDHAAREAARVLGTQHHERTYNQNEILAVLPRVVYHLESFEPALVRPAIHDFFLAETASDYVKVLLNSEGAEEIYPGDGDLQSVQPASERKVRMLDSIWALHNTGLQRVDRISMVFGLEMRMPFLDIKSTALGLELATNSTIYKDRPSSNYSLREAFRDHFPEEIFHPTAQRLSLGADLPDVIVQVAEWEISDSEFQSESTRLLNHWEYRLPNKEALYYYKLMRRYYDDRWIFPAMAQSQSL